MHAWPLDLLPLATALVPLASIDCMRPWLDGQTHGVIEKQHGRLKPRLSQDADPITLGLMEADPLLIQAEHKLIGQADELVVLVDSTKFEQRSSLVLCPLERAKVVITDDGISDRAAAMLEAADVELIVAPVAAANEEDGAAS